MGVWLERGRDPQEKVWEERVEADPDSVVSPAGPSQASDSSRHQEMPVLVSLGSGVQGKGPPVPGAALQGLGVVSHCP